jgi:predicted RNA binding protein YcfA (HicA-like mRNA interferase family)
MALPVLSGSEVVRNFEKLGWRVVRQSGSQIIMTKEGEIAHSPYRIIAKSQEELYEV